jgi:outer membrane protein OmpA-like peptidoglycan-associated protein
VDTLGNPSANLTLSKGRANSVVTYLVNKGIAKERFQLIDGKGDTEPLADNSTAVGKAKNRRVQITLLK